MVIPRRSTRVELPAALWREIELWAWFRGCEPEDLLVQAWHEFYEQQRAS